MISVNLPGRLRTVASRPSSDSFSVTTAASVGLYARNPIIPTAALLAWEGAAGILPHMLQKVSILHYLQSLYPVPAPMDADTPVLIRLLASPAAPASRPGAILGLLVLTAFVLWIAARAVRRMQISYGTEA